MAGYVRAGRNDTFCSIAVRNGFRDCDPIRSHANNAAIAVRECRRRDRVFVPDVRPGVDAVATATTTLLKE